MARRGDRRRAHAPRPAGGHVRRAQGAPRITLVPAASAGLVERARDGDADAYGMLVKEHQAVAFRTAWLVTGSAADAEDAAQDAFVKAWKALPRFRSGAPFRPWLLAIVANEARNRRRASGRRAAHEERAPLPLADPGPEAAAVAGADRARVARALRALREEDRLAIACRYFLDLSEEETAAAMDVRRGTVKSRLARALERLRAELEVDA